MADDSLRAGAQKKQNWLLLRGLARQSEHWGEFPNCLERTLPDVHTLSLDLPGNGRRSQELSPWNLREVAQTVREDFLRRNGGSLPKGPVYICAISMGAMVCLEWMDNYPGEIEGAVWINTSLKGLSPFYQRLCWEAYLALLRILLTQDVAVREQRILKLTSASRLPSEEELGFRVRLWEKSPVQWKNFFRQLWSASQLKASGRQGPSNVLLLNSIGDRLVHPECSVAIAQAWKLPLKRHPWAGHDLPLDDPQWVADRIADWLREQS